MTLFFDTETSGLPQKNLPTEHPSQPRLLQLGCLMLDGESIAAEVNLTVKPDGFTIPESASAIHGITDERAHAAGVPIALALSVFRHLVRLSETIVGYNVDFDLFVICGEFARNGKANLWVEIEATPQFCVMQPMTDICKIPSPYYPGQFKWPKLIEAYQHVFNESLVDAHDAMADVRATAKLYRWLKKEETPC
jgi:DNA polymerase III subunit epsilon